MTVTYLERQKEGPLSLGSLSRGQVRLLSPEEVQMLQADMAK
jgi:16S rRNA U516 pseudouridylate synthase RsuA-like enzyme